MSTLAQALFPLYRGYLRRLDEMAGRVGEATLLREPIARDEGQVMLRQASGFVLRFDVADSSSGETFEVHGAHPDGPAERALRVGPLPFQVEPGNWEELPVRCSFRAPPPADDAAALAELLHGWAVLAAHGGFASLAEPASAGRWSGRLHSATVRIDGADVVAVLDMGTCPPAALDCLADALATFGQERAPVERVTIGGRGDPDVSPP